MPHLPAGVQHVDAELVAQPLERPRTALQHRPEGGGGRLEIVGMGGMSGSVAVGSGGGEGVPLEDNLVTLLQALPTIPILQEAHVLPFPAPPCRWCHCLHSPPHSRVLTAIPPHSTRKRHYHSPPKTPPHSPPFLFIPLASGTVIGGSCSGRSRGLAGPRGGCIGLGH